MSNQEIRAEIEPELDDAIHAALLNAVGGELAFNATEAVVRVIAAHRDAKRDMDAAPKRMNGLLGFDLGAL